MQLYESCTNITTVIILPVSIQRYVFYSTEETRVVTSSREYVKGKNNNSEDRSYFCLRNFTISGVGKQRII